MVRRHAKRSRKKYMGSRSWGAGNIKKRRGKGSRGGKGFGGGHKHKWLHMIKYEPGHYGKRGFTSVGRQKAAVINLSKINEMAASGKLQKQDEKFLFDFSGKVLGAGTLAHPVIITAHAFSKSALEKIRNAKGEAKAKELGRELR